MDKVKENIEEKKEEDIKNGSEQVIVREHEKSFSNFFKSFINGTLLSREVILKQFPFVIYLTFIAIILIANRYGAEKVVRNTQSITNELKELKAEQISVTSELMRLSQQSEVIKLVNQYEIGLSELIEPPKKIIIKEKE
ncbi:MAG: hypothetical protein COS14_07090 [Bacteroidetes bacterium CG02_land_8_20_14_3_00_31_25]|nr:hypothetical protein [Bacteroidota bacterium]PIV58911.1 MAG: hypothetical protein COS14_07090 [Bacteroidetes bacterium CG02_land_8_20_14_3_00_31_25]PIX35751.1 MAG: hypothetical protein COZ59_04760 [Bacteroidetes bacterium CG_4_8_14_3_um_filter_31_14]